MRISMFLKKSALFLGIIAAFSAFGGTAMAATSPSSIHISNNWAGYAATSGTYTSISGSWVIPNSSRTSNVISADAEWVGIGGMSDKDLIQVGTQSVIHNGKTQYSAWYELLPDTQRIVPFSVHPGDTISASVTEITPSTNLWHITLTDQTTGQTYQTNVTYQSSNSSAEWIVERPLAITNNSTGYLPLSDFGTVTFTNATTVDNGTTETLGQSGAEQLIMTSSNSRLTAAPQPENNDSSFSVLYLSSSQSAQYLQTLRTYTLQPETNASSRSPHYQDISTSYVIHVVFGFTH